MPIDIHASDTYFIVAHIHYVLFGGSVFTIFAGIYYWFPKMTGRMYNERLGKLHFWLTFIGFNLTFFPMHYIGLQGMPRRVADYAHRFADINLFISIASFGLGASTLVFLYNMARSWAHGPIAPANPWRSLTLEWQVSSPPPTFNFDEVPAGRRQPVRVRRARREARDLRLPRAGTGWRSTDDAHPRDRERDGRVADAARRDARRGRARPDDRVTVIAPVNEPSRLFAEADVFVLPTRADCLGVVLMEAAAAGLPVITTDVGAIRETLLPDESGSLIPADDARALKQAITALVDDPERRRAYGSGELCSRPRQIRCTTQQPSLLDFVGELVDTRPASRRAA